MKHIYTSSNYVTKSSRIDEACNWIEKLGISYSKSRLGKYKKLFSSLAEYQLLNDLSSFYEKYSFEELVNAVHESDEIIRTYEGLSSYCDTDLINRIKVALKGHELYALDNKDRSGRDFSFELSIASKFAKKSYSIDFGHDADLKINMSDRNLYIECKRLKSKNQIRKRIEKGLSQLHKRYVNDEKSSQARGILALSIGKMLNKDLGLLEAENHKELGDKAFSYNNQFIQRYNKLWQEKTDRRTLGVVIVLDTPGVLKGINQLTSCHQVTMNNSVSESSKDYMLLLSIAEQVFGEKR